MLSTINPVFLVPAAATTAYTLATINNAFDHEPNPLIGLLDSHGMSLILSIVLGHFIMHNGWEISLLSLFCLLISTIPFFFDGAMSLVSI